MKYNTAGQRFHVIAFNASGRVSGDAANLSVTLSKDGGSRVALADTSATEIGTTGEYTFDLSQAETDAHALSFAPASSTSGVQVLGVPSNVIYTEAVTAADVEGLRYRIGIDGTATAPTATGAKLGDLLISQVKIDATGAVGKIPVDIDSAGAASSVTIDDSTYTSSSVNISLLLGTTRLNSIIGDLGGRILGGGTGTITGTGVQAQLPDGAISVGKFSTALQALWNNLIAMITGSGASAAFTEKAMENTTSPETIADAVRTELSTELGRIDDNITSRATPADVSPTIEFNPTIEPTPVTVNPTELSVDSLDNIADRLFVDPANKLQVNVDGSVDAGVTLSPDDIDDIVEGLTTGGVATLAKQEEILTAIDASSSAGPGGISKTLTIQVSGIPVDGAAVWVTTDSDGLNTIAGTLYTNALGQVTFMLEVGTYYAWAQRAGINFTNPTEFTVTA
jgi:hypothetical protein